MKNRKIYKSKKTGRRFVATRIQPCEGNGSVHVVPEEDFEEYLANISYSHGFYEGYSPWPVPERDLEDTGETYSPRISGNGDSSVKDYWR